jgi:hypothetical protein
VREAVLRRTKLGILAVAAQLGCTAPNPAYRPVVARADAEQAAADAGAPVLPADAALDAAIAPDLAPPAQFAPPDAAPDLMPDARPAGLLAHWRLDEAAGPTAVDELGNNPGELNGASRVTLGFPGARFPNPGAVSFDGQNDYIELGIRGLPALQAEKTVSVWFRAASVSMTARRNLVCFNNPGAEESWQLGLDRGYPAVWNWGPAPAPLIAATRADLQWHHLAYVYDGTMQRLYVDGKQVASFAQAPPAAMVAGAYLGTYDPDQDQNELWTGVIDDVRVYQRGLTPEEVAWLADGND